MTPKQRIISNTMKAVSGKPICDPNAPCQPCNRSDLQLLVVIPSVVPADHAAALKEAGYAWAPSFDAAFGEVKREATVPVARIMREGYVYLYYLHRKRWDVWQVMHNGLTRKIMHQVDKEVYEKMQSAFSGAPAPKTCSRGAANVPAHLIGVSGAQTTPKLWLAFSSQLWSGYTLQRFADNPEVDVPGPDGKPVKKELRALRGREINPQSVLASGISHSALPLNQAALEHGVADYANTTSAAYKRAFDITLAPLDEGRPGKAGAFADAVRALERASAPTAHPNLYLNKSIILMLPDPLGVVEQHNHLRLAEQEAKRLWTIGANGITQAPDPERVWKLRSSIHAEMIEQWEAARATQELTSAVSRKMHNKVIPMTEEEFALQKIAGKIQPGSEWSPRPLLDGGFDGGLYANPKLDANHQPMYQTVASQHTRGAQTRLGRLTLPPDVVKKAADKHGADKATGFRKRLRGRLDFAGMTSFNDQFKSESEKWDLRIARFDRDYLAWRESTSFKSFMLYDFNNKINFGKLVAAFGSLDQQVGELVARVIALEKAFGGGAISPASDIALAAMYKLKPDNPASWLDNAMYKPFSFYDEVWDDPGNLSEATEGVAGSAALIKLVREAVNRSKERHHFESAARSILAGRAQLTNLIASAIDAKTAKNLGLQAISQEQARKFLQMHIKIELLFEELLTTDSMQRSAQKFVFNLKVPVGIAIDTVRDAMHARLMVTKFTAKNETSRQERRYTERQFRNLEGRLTGEMNYPVLLDRDMIDKMNREAVAGGRNLVDVVPDGRLGLSSGSIKIPEEVARRLIREQALTVKGVLSATDTKILGAVVVVQILALLDTADKIGKEQGMAQADAILSTTSTALALVETGSLFRLHVWTMRMNGMRTITTTAATSMARLRLGAGLAGAGAGVLDAALAFTRADNAKRSGDAATASAFETAGKLYTGSAALSMLGTFATYQSYMGSGFIVNQVGLRAAVLMGGWATGVGIVLSLAAFGFMLYALHTGYQMTDVFLDRSYWGKGEHEKFGKLTRDQIARIRSDTTINASARQNAVNSAVNDGMIAEIESFLGLTVGFEFGFEWHKNWFSDEAVAFTAKTGDWPLTRKLAVKIELFASEKALGVVVLDQKEQVLVPCEDPKKKGIFELESAWVFKKGSHEQYTHARVSFVVHDKTHEGVLLVVRDTLLARRDA
jgi:hypothetical protein